MKLPWDRIDKFTAGPSVARYELCCTDRGYRRVVTAPRDELLALDEVLSGHEYPLTEPLVAIAKGLPVVDFGSHVGAAAVYFEEILKPPRVLCFEPNEDAFKFLLRNTGDETECTKAAVGGETGIHKYYQRTPIYTAGCLPHDEPEPPVVEVPMYAATQAIEMIGGEIGVLKIDIEGHEAAALKSMEHDLPRCRIVFVEYHDEKLRRLIDLLMRDFQVFHAKVCGGAWWGQGTIGYVRSNLKDKLKQNRSQA